MRSNKSPLLFDKPSGNIPSYNQKTDNLLLLNAMINSKLNTIKRNYFDKRGEK
ncbi:hypothetical protein [Oceanobacillus sp. CFH 90083]|uniref:hypothetical protein n=1 Tax=Oceanobacillus sp. CFH 90083 TaxID=2592336 RepID=UPI0018846FAE|nr:hypothetical protein [Oceanobacillus sp. CFH 90083]